MKSRSPFGFLCLATAIVVAGAVGIGSQWEDTARLTADLERMRLETRELERLRTENKQLRERQIPATELDSLRADHAALPRLRAEIETLKSP